MLRFEDLRVANIARQKEVFKANQDWTLLELAGAMAGEAGEAANQAKKIRRGDYTPGTPEMEQALWDVGVELADTVVYADVIATRLGIPLEDFLRWKFNTRSREIGSEVFIKEGGQCVS